MQRTEPGAIADDKPFVLVASEARGQVITAVNGPAWRDGIRVGMALADARAMLPGLRSRAAEPARDQALLLQLARWAGRYGPNRNVENMDGLWIDSTGVAHLFAPKVSDILSDTVGTTGATVSDQRSDTSSSAETALLADLVRRLTASGLTVRAGLADTLGAAHALARFVPAAAGKSCAIAQPGETRAALAPLPVEALRLTPDAVLLLRRLGLGRIGDLYGLPRAALERRFRDRTIAARVLTRLDQALGISAEPCRPLTEPPALSVRRIYAEPLIVSVAIEAEVQGLATDLAERLAAAGQGVRRLALSLYRTDASVATVTAGTSQASRDPRHLFGLIAVKLAGIDAGFGIDAIVLDAESIERLGAEQQALASALGRDGAVATGVLIDRLANRLGASRVLTLERQASHQPERSVVTIPALASGDRRRAQLEEPLFAHGRAPRPPFLLPRPEAISVIAEVPEGAPARFTWRRLARAVIKAEGPERIAPEWWRTLHGANLAPIARRVRDYYRLEDEAGGRYWVFRLGLYQQEAEDGAPAWYMHGLFP